MKRLLLCKNNYLYILIWTLSVQLSGSQGDITHLTECCNLGTKSAIEKSNCDYIDEINAFAPEWKGLCISTFGMCCLKELRNQHCVAGRRAAREELSCIQNQKFNSAAYTECCEACRIGFAVAAIGYNCSSNIFKNFTRYESYMKCCNDVPEDAFILEDDQNICGTFSNLCSHICENNKDSYICKCREGYKLNDDKITCSLIEDNYLSNLNDNDNDENSSCKRGYYYDENTGTCKDINECNNDPCPDDFICVNYNGSYKCRNDILSAYDETSTTIKYPVIPCSPGYQLKHNRCVDIDECLNDKNACDSNQICENKSGYYSCECKIGFKKDPTTKACIDINECQINNHNCLPTQRCDNTYGSYTCMRTQSCGTGYTLNAETSVCEDDNECTLGTHNCPPGYQCRNTIGSFRCDKIIIYHTSQTTSSTPDSTRTISRTTPTTTSTTPVPNTIPYQNSYATTTDIYRHWPHVSSQTQNRQDYISTSTHRFSLDHSCGYGFQRNTIGACVDIDECQNPNMCASHQKCINLNGSYRCQNIQLCPGGYVSTPDGTSCIDIDECETGTHSCGPEQTCHNRISGYICSCPIGHDLNGTRCIDINECEYQRDHVCPMNSYCINTIGSYYCECKEGFRKLDSNSNVCVDIDECKEMFGLCEHKCINFWGSYRCSCDPGYELYIDNRTCNDIDECEVHKSYKLCVGFCNNTPGSYECSCPPGYELGTDGISCRDVDECSLPSVCNGSNEICTNIRGSYRCNVISCPYGYRQDPDQKNRCILINQFCEGEECYQKPSSYSYNFITTVSKMLIPPQGRTLFTMRFPLSFDNINYDLKIARIQVPPNVEKATIQHFLINKIQNQIQLSLMRSLEGPQDIELELSTTGILQGQPRMKNIFKIFIIVSMYSF